MEADAPTRRQFLGMGAALAVARPFTAALPQPARTGRVVIVGDSLTFDSRSGLEVLIRAKGVRSVKVDAVPGRSIAQGWQTIVQLRASGFDSDAWVVALGSNDFFNPIDPNKLVRRTLDRLGDVDVAWPTLAARDAEFQPAVARFNRALRAVAATDDRLHVLEWGRLVRAHPEWFRDPVHMTAFGRATRRVMLVQAAVTARDRAGSRRAR